MIENMTTMPVSHVIYMEKIWSIFWAVKHMETVHKKKNWKDILENNPEWQFDIEKIAQKRMKHRQRLLENEAAGLPSIIWLQSSSWLLSNVIAFVIAFFGINDDDDDDDW